VSWLALLNSITSVTDELNFNSVLISNQILLNILNSAQSLTMSYEDISTAPIVINNALKALSFLLVSKSQENYVDLVVEYLNLEVQLISLFFNTSFDDVVYGQQRYELVLDNIRYTLYAPTTSSILEGDIQLSTPLTALERYSNHYHSSPNIGNLNLINPGVIITIVEYKLSGLSTDLASISSPLMIQVFDSPAVCSGGCNLNVMLQNRNLQKYKQRLPVQSFSATCSAGKTSLNEYLCSDGRKTVSSCNGTFNGVEESFCPTNVTRPVCYAASFDSMSTIVCDSVAYTTSNTTCRCYGFGDSTSIVIYSQKEFEYVNRSSIFRPVPINGEVSAASDNKIVTALYKYRYVLGSLGILSFLSIVLLFFWMWYFKDRKARDISTAQNYIKELVQSISNKRILVDISDIQLPDDIKTLVDGPFIVFISEQQHQKLVSYIQQLQTENRLWDEFQSVGSPARKRLINLSKLRALQRSNPKYILTERDSITQKMSTITATTTAASTITQGNLANEDDSTQTTVHIYQPQIYEDDSNNDYEEKDMSVGDIYPQSLLDNPLQNNRNNFNNDFYLRSVEKVPLTINITMNLDMDNSSTISTSSNGFTGKPHLTTPEQLRMDFDRESIKGGSVQIVQEDKVDERVLDIDFHLNINDSDENYYDDNGYLDDLPDNDDDLFADFDDPPFRTETRIIPTQADEIVKVEEAPPLHGDTVEVAVSDIFATEPEQFNDIPMEPIPSDPIVADSENTESHDPVPPPPPPPETTTKRNLVLSPQLASSKKDLSKSKSRRPPADVIQLEPFRLSLNPAASPPFTTTKQTLQMMNSSPRNRGRNAPASIWKEAAAAAGREGMDSDGQPTEFQDWMRLNFQHNTVHEEPIQSRNNRYLKPTKSSHSKNIGQTTKNSSIESLPTGKNKQSGIKKLF